MRTRTKRLNAKIETGIWGTFTKNDSQGNLINIRIIVPEIVDEKTLLINIHEYAHAYELYQELGTKYKPNIDQSEAYAVSKEKEYLLQKKVYE